MLGPRARLPRAPARVASGAIEPTARDLSPTSTDEEESRWVSWCALAPTASSEGALFLEKIVESYETFFMRPRKTAREVARKYGQISVVRDLLRGGAFDPIHD
jgi:hypothetical protein